MQDSNNKDEVVKSPEYNYDLVHVHTCWSGTRCCLERRINYDPSVGFFPFNCNDDEKYKFATLDEICILARAIRRWGVHSKIYVSDPLCEEHPQNCPPNLAFRHNELTGEDVTPWPECHERACPRWSIPGPSLERSLLDCDQNCDQCWGGQYRDTFEPCRRKHGQKTHYPKPAELSESAKLNEICTRQYTEEHTRRERLIYLHQILDIPGCVLKRNFKYTVTEIPK